jgi:hypothetical protein
MNPSRRHHRPTESIHPSCSAAVPTSNVDDEQQDDVWKRTPQPHTIRPPRTMNDGRRATPGRRSSTRPRRKPPRRTRVSARRRPIAPSTRPGSTSGRRSSCSRRHRSTNGKHIAPGKRRYSCWRRLRPTSRQPVELSAIPNRQSRHWHFRPSCRLAPSGRTPHRCPVPAGIRCHSARVFSWRQGGKRWPRQNESCASQTTLDRPRNARKPSSGRQFTARRSRGCR